MKGLEERWGYIASVFRGPETMPASIAQAAGTQMKKYDPNVGFNKTAHLIYRCEAVRIVY